MQCVCLGVWNAILCLEDSSTNAHLDLLLLKTIDVPQDIAAVLTIVLFYHKWVILKRSRTWGHLQKIITTTTINIDWKEQHNNDKNIVVVFVPIESLLIFFSLQKHFLWILWPRINSSPSNTVS